MQVSQFISKARITLVILCSLFFIHSLRAQEKPDSITLQFTLDSVVISAVKKGLNPQYFIDVSKADTSMFRAFKNLHFHTLIIDFQSKVYDKKGSVLNDDSGKTQQFYQDSCRWQKNISRQSKGNLKDKKGAPISTTQSMFYSIFLHRDTVCNEKKAIHYKPGMTLSRPSDLQQQRDWIKSFVFAPQTVKIDVPFFRNKMKTQLYSEEVSKFYRFSLSAVQWQGRDAYLLDAVVDTIQYAAEAENLLIKRMKTWFDPETKQVLGRYYQLYTNGWLVDMDITLDIQLQEINGEMVPQSIVYKGFWKFPGKGTDKADIKMYFTP